MSTLFENDFLTDPARAALRENVQRAYSHLLPRAPHEPARAPLEKMATTGAVNEAADPAMDAALQAGLWLWHDFLAESHTLSQGIESPEGAWWHAIMHRREGDFSNAKYWYRQVGRHPMFDTLSVGVNEITGDEPADKALFALTRSGWDPAAFVDLCQTVHGRPDDSTHPVAVAIQQAEWRTLFDACLRAAR